MPRGIPLKGQRAPGGGRKATGSVRVYVRLAPEALARLDKLRASTPRGAYLADLILRKSID